MIIGNDCCIPKFDREGAKTRKTRAIVGKSVGVLPAIAVCPEQCCCGREQQVYDAQFSSDRGSAGRCRLE